MPRPSSCNSAPLSLALPRPIHNLAKQRLHLVPGALLVLTRHGSHELLRLMMHDQIDRRAAESAPGQARPKTSRLSAGEFDEQVQFRHAVFEKVPRAFMALEHILAELAKVV